MENYLTRKSIRFINLSFYIIISRFKGHHNTDYKIDSCLTQDDAHIVSGSEDGKIYFWDLVEVYPLIIT